MTHPTKGSVAGKPIKTEAQTKEFDEGYERTFGERKAVRGRFVYTQDGQPLEAPVQVDADWRNPGHGVSLKSEDEVYGNLGVATDGETPINTRRRHREYMKENGLTLSEDYKGEWAAADKRRADVTNGDFDHKARKETIERAAYDVAQRKRRGW